MDKYLEQAGIYSYEYEGQTYYYKIEGDNEVDYPTGKPLTEADIKGKSIEEVISHAKQLAWDSYEAKIEPFKAHGLSLEKNIVLSIVDRSWQEHIDTMSKLREGIHLRSYAQNKPLQAYISEGYELFEDMLQRISQEVVSFCLRMKVEVRKQ